jgi:hypothetical protein
MSGLSAEAAAVPELGEALGQAVSLRLQRYAAVANAAVAVDCLQALQVSLKLPAKVTFDRQAARGDGLNDLVDLLGAKILGAHIGAYMGLLENPFGRCRANSVNVWQRSFDSLIAGNVYSKESGHNFLQLN